jgi:DNA invertase Pin-like site-specific DNA recombinase
MQTKTISSIRDLGAHTTKELLAILEGYRQQGIEVVSETEHSILEIIKAAEAIDREHRMAGIEKAQQEGKLKGRQSSIDNAEFAKLYAAWQTGNISQYAIARKLGMSRVAITRACARFKERGHV